MNWIVPTVSALQKSQICINPMYFHRDETHVSICSYCILVNNSSLWSNDFYIRVTCDIDEEAGSLSDIYKCVESIDNLWHFCLLLNYEVI